MYHPQCWLGTLATTRQSGITPEKVCMENFKAAKLEKLKRLQDAVKKLVHLRSIKKLKESRAVITACSSFEL